MFNFEFFFIFIFLGLGLRLFLGPVASITIVILISVGWGFVFGPWAIMAFIELIIGWAGGQAAANSKLKKDLVYKLKEENDCDTENSDDVESSKDESFFGRMEKFLENNEQYFEYVYEKFGIGKPFVSAIYGDYEDTVSYAIKIIVLSEIMDIADSQLRDTYHHAGELGLHVDDFGAMFEENVNEWHYKMENMSDNEKNEWVNKGLDIGLGEKWSSTL